MHNWIRFYLLEKNSTEFNYMGFIIKRIVSLFYYMLRIIKKN